MKKHIQLDSQIEELDQDEDVVPLKAPEICTKKGKKPRHKRDGCGGPLPGEDTTPLPDEETIPPKKPELLPGEATTGLAGEATTGLPGEATTELPGEEIKWVKVVESTHVIHKDSRLTRNDVRMVRISIKKFTKGMLTSINQAIKKLARIDISSRKILVRSMLK
jgi:hypothetical protein